MIGSPARLRRRSSVTSLSLLSLAKSIRKTHTACNSSRRHEWLGQLAAVGAARLAHERRPAHRAEAVLAPILRADHHLLALLEVVEEGHRRLRREVLKEHVVHLDHRGVDAGAKALDLREGEEAIGGRLARLDAQVRLNRVPVPSHTRRRRTNLVSVEERCIGKEERKELFYYYYKI